MKIVGIQQGMATIRDGQNLRVCQGPEVQWKLPATRAALLVLQENAGGPMHYREITRIILARGLVATASERLERVVYSSMSRQIREASGERWFKHVGKGVYALTSTGKHAQVWRFEGADPAPLSSRPSKQARTDLTWIEAAELVLARVGQPMRANALLISIWQSGLKPKKDGAVPLRLLRNELARAVKQSRRIRRVSPGVYQFIE